MRRIAVHHRTWSSGLGICLLLAVALVLASCGSDGNKGVTTSTASTSATLGTSNGNHSLPTTDEIVAVIVAKVEHITGKLPDEEDLDEIQRKVDMIVGHVPTPQEVQEILNHIVDKFCGKEATVATSVPTIPTLPICPPNGGTT